MAELGLQRAAVSLQSFMEKKEKRGQMLQLPQLEVELKDPHYWLYARSEESKSCGETRAGAPSPTQANVRSRWSHAPGEGRQAVEQTLEER